MKLQPYVNPSKPFPVSRSVAAELLRDARREGGYFERVTVRSSRGWVRSDSFGFAGLIIFFRPA